MAGASILVVEDEAIVAFNLQRILIGFGYQVPETVETGLKALQAVEKFHPDLVLMDIHLQGNIDGIETAHFIRAYHDIPIIYLTAYADESRLSQACETAPYGYLIKPVQDRDLRATIETALLRHRLDMKLKESETAYRALYHNTPAMLQTVDPGGAITQVSNYWLATFGYTREEVVGRPALDFIDGSFLRYLHEEILPEFHRAGAIRDMECQFVGKNGRVVDVYCSAAGVFDAQGCLLHVLVALVDISARKRAEAAERDQHALAEALRDTAAALSSTLSFAEVLERVLNNVGNVVPYDAVNIMLVENDTARIVRCHGYRELGREEEALFSSHKIRELPQLFRMAETRQPVTYPSTHLLPGWEPEWACSYAGAPIVIKGRLVGFINLIGLTPGFYTPEIASRLQAFADQVAIAIENARLYAEVQRLATLDDVTGIFNRRRLLELGQREYERARRYGLPFAAVLLDIDGFKKVNDTYGHIAGDRVLAGIAAAISRHIREVDIFGRYGGEEFIVFLPQADRRAALEVAERLRALVAQQIFETDREKISVTISLGVALLSDDTLSLAALIGRTDKAMYAAKQAGRNRVELYA